MYSCIKDDTESKVFRYLTKKKTRNYYQRKRIYSNNSCESQDMMKQGDPLTELQINANEIMKYFQTKKHFKNHKKVSKKITVKLCDKFIMNVVKDLIKMYVLKYLAGKYLQLYKSLCLTHMKTVSKIISPRKYKSKRVSNYQSTRISHRNMNCDKSGKISIQCISSYNSFPNKVNVKSSLKQNLVQPIKSTNYTHFDSTEPFLSRNHHHKMINLEISILKSKNKLNNSNIFDVLFPKFTYNNKINNLASTKSIRKNKDFLQIEYNRNDNCTCKTKNCDKKINPKNVLIQEINITEIKDHNYDFDDRYQDPSNFDMDSCSIWKFPPWLVERLDLDRIFLNLSTLDDDGYRVILMRHLKSTATDLLLYQTVRREFLRTILIIELNNIVKLLECVLKLGLGENFKNKILQGMRPIVKALDDPEKSYIPEMEEMAYVLDEFYLLISPDHILKDEMSYSFNIVYCSYLLSHWSIIFNEKCVGGIVDNTWIANESKYLCMIMLTPQVYENSIHSDLSTSTEKHFRIEAYFDVDRGKFSGFEINFTNSLRRSTIIKKNLECLIYSYLTKDTHWVEDKNIFLLNGPVTKRNTDFLNIYYSLLKTATS